MARNALRALALGAGIALLVFAMSFVCVLFTRAASRIEDAGKAAIVPGSPRGRSARSPCSR